MSESCEPTPRQRQTAAARKALAERFGSPEEKREFYEAIGRKSAEGRIVLSADDAKCLGDAYALLAKIAARGKLRAPSTSDEHGETVAA